MLVCIKNNKKQPRVFDELYVEADRVWLEEASDKSSNFCDVWAKEKQYVLGNATIKRDHGIIVINGCVAAVRTW